MQSQPLKGEDALFEEALLGWGLPEKAEWHLWQAGLSYHADDVAEEHLKQAETLAPGHAAVLIGIYRFNFYKGRLKEALDIASRCLEMAAKETNLPSDWRNVSASDAVFGRYEEIAPRFFLFTLKSYAYLQLRLGNVEEGREAVMKLLDLDPGDKIGAKVLLDVIEGMGQESD